jgi:hypothetical protein
LRTHAGRSAEPERREQQRQSVEVAHRKFRLDSRRVREVAFNCPRSGPRSGLDITRPARVTPSVCVAHRRCVRQSAPR